MALKITFNMVHPKRLTNPRNNDDEIYFAVAPMGVRRKPGGAGELEQTHLRGAISRVQVVDDENPQSYVPKLVKTGNSYTVETGNAERVVVSVALCEKDNGTLYDKLRNNPHFKIPENYSLDWEDVIKVIPSNPTDVKAWVVNVGTFLYGFMKGIMADDYIDADPLDVDLKATAKVGKTLVLKGSGGHYEIEVEAEPVSVHA